MTGGTARAEPQRLPAGRSRLVTATLAVVAWGVFALGSVYWWAYVPLIAASAAVGIAGLCRPAPRARLPLWLVAAVVLVVVGCSLQLLPLSQPTILRLSPATDGLLRTLDLTYQRAAAKGEAVHSLSVTPGSTRLALACLVSFSLLMLGTAHMLTREAVGQLTRGLIVLGVLVAMAGALQKPFFGKTIYGFWTPFEGDGFGPFVNRNHFAGWMLMTVPLAAGYFLSRLARLPWNPKTDWHNRLLSFSSRDVAQTMLIGSAVLLMAIALVLTLSRSGLLGLVVAAVLLAALLLCRAGLRRQGIALAFLTTVLVLPITWVGVDTLEARFTARNMVGLDGRLGAWADAWRVARAFPLAGTGLNTYGTAMLFYQTSDPVHHYDAAHSDYLQLAAEGGLLVAVPAAMTLILLVITIGARTRSISEHASEYWIRMGAIAGLIAIAAQELTDFSLQIPANAVLFAVVGGIALRVPTSEKRE